MGRRGAFGRMTELAWCRAGLTALGVVGLGGCIEETIAGDGGGGQGAGEPANYPSNQPCSVLPQAGCAAGHSCQVATLGGATMCQQAGGVPDGGLCASNSDCAPGLSCVWNMCRSYCHVPEDCAGLAPACFQVEWGAQPVAGWLACSRPCNPADPGNATGMQGLFACPPGMGCYPAQPGGSLGSNDCYVAGTGPVGTACQDGGDCAPGLVCLSDGSSASCRPMCVMGLGGCACAPFAQPFYAATPNGILEVGYCP